MKRTMFKKAKNSFLGRMLRRLAGEEKGAVMMEYIVVALLIAAAAVVAVGVFGSTASGMFASLTNFMTNQRDTGDTRLDQVRKDANEGAKQNQDHVKDTINTDNTNVKDATGWGEGSSGGSGA